MKLQLLREIDDKGVVRVERPGFEIKLKELLMSWKLEREMEISR